MEVKIADEVLRRFPDLRVLMRTVRGVIIHEVDPPLEKFKEEVFTDVRRKFTLELLKDEPVLRAYRDFFWRLGIDSTKVRPAAEALIRRVLGGRSIPRINTAVDAYNLASVATCTALAAFDTDRLQEGILMRFAGRGEEFLGIGMDSPVTLEGGEIIMSDGPRLVAIYPYRDAEYSKVTLQTKDLLIVSCGVPSITLDRLEEALEKATQFITRFCGGEDSR